MFGYILKIGESEWYFRDWIDGLL